MKNKKKQNKKSYLVLLLLLCISVGFAALSAGLSIVGTASVKANTWSIKFANAQVTKGATFGTGDAQITNTATVNDGTANADLKDVQVDFSVQLQKPGDVFEFTVDVVNDGTLDAYLKNVVASSLPDAEEAYMNFTYTYSDGTAIAANDLLPAGKHATVKVTVEYDAAGVTNENMPTTDTTPVDLSINLTYEQKLADTTVNASAPVADNTAA